MAILTWLGVPGTAEAWAQLGFCMRSDNTFQVGRVWFEPGMDEPAWGFYPIADDQASLGVTTIPSHVPDVAAESHPNVVDRIDHVVYAVPELDPAVDALTALLGAPPKRRAFPRGPSGPEMAFFTVGEGFIEVVVSGRPPSLWGIAFGAPDLDRTVAAVRSAGGPIGDPKPAVQGGRIASVWKGHVGWGIAIMEKGGDRNG